MIQIKMLMVAVLFIFSLTFLLVSSGMSPQQLLPYVKEEVLAVGVFWTTGFLILLFITFFQVLKEKNEWVDV